MSTIKRLKSTITELERVNGLQYRSIVKLTSEVKSETIARKSVAGLFRVQIDRLGYEKARLRGEWATAEADHCKLMELIHGWESRTGKDHAALLKGDYAQPFGTEGPGR